MKALGVVGYSGSGKTTLLCALIPLLRGYGLRVAVVKSTHHDVDWDAPGKDSYRLREAGADVVLLQGPKRWFMTRPAPTEVSLETIRASLQPLPDLLLMEGNKALAVPKIEVHRRGLGRPLLAPDDPCIMAVATDGVLDIPCVQLDLNTPSAIAQFIRQWIKKED
ncbi:MULTISPECIES: molybdopterin-guanine dinucleotide biosynthesis protein B [Acidithiobacillus]|jgi:molybdopterin-guanine dinucleotide biosynthesis protein B|uniref:Molybdopterin-guanine dinucleotide biosynthesis protein B n=2 Tax=Acidithiobacillus ferrooxidans TaxID=920 RepID=B7J4T7_ACIF2|nr:MULTISPECIES: molybdopterin-guanine dinucleotide biosynthesis protein B [Acidithiobacillus]MCL5956965.1 molybdopterin-guanine dinucleotide biosynthesis protein B [Gammaproteobacteria bacterium]ACH83956.1 molybdopterin-guanine dinucleotide biosynthesis protein B [Acidithiobacillus ferrooxidans ATCC 53993]ACK80767.1 molybdopterin-guanine dinucleotide biosynthesis protein B [Acidithiobacillus ferrooxidans ATCC 23270]MBN6746116.1 molybdopterin-guanine dinucleotide biosynthesis protein B [Acidith